MSKPIIDTKSQIRVKQQYANCYAACVDGEYTILDSDGNDILAEYLLPFGKDESEAWDLALLTVKTTQNFNRTHPERLSLELDEEKLSRMSRRRNLYE